MYIFVFIFTIGSVMKGSHQFVFTKKDRWRFQGFIPQKYSLLEIHHRRIRYFLTYRLPIQHNDLSILSFPFD